MEFLNNRYDFMIIFDVTNGNPNGDPDNDNQPRLDIDTNIGLVTDVCLKRKIRNWIKMNKDGEEGFEIYIDRTMPLRDRADEAIKAKKDLKIDKDKEERFVIDYMTNKYFDIRTFGAAIARFSANEVKLAGNAGQLLGPVQLTFAQSIDPIYPQKITITRQAIETPKDFENKKTEIGNKWIVPYGLYVSKGFISANIAQKMNFSENDVNVLFESILHMFDDDHSAARGDIVVRKLIIFKHDSKHGNAPSHKLFDTIKINKNTEIPRKFNDYDIEIPNNTDMPEGVELIILE